MRDENQSPMLVSFFDWIVHSSSEQDTHPKKKKKNSEQDGLPL